MKGKRTIFTLMLVVILKPMLAQSDHQMLPLKVSDNNPHYLQHNDGSPFFWLGDTGWEMLRRLSREEIELYLENRKQKGFNVIQAVLISEFIHMDGPTNYYNDSIFLNEDPEKPALVPGNNPNSDAEYDYWDHVEYAIKTAEAKGLYLGLVASWGEWVIPRTDRPLFNNTSQTYNYGRFIGNRFRKYNNLIWILGGDRHPDERPEGPELWRSMAEGIADGRNDVNKMDGEADYSTTLMTHHSFLSSSKWFHNDEWIDFHCWGTYHAEINNSRSYTDTWADWSLPDPKPTLNAEPCYEGHGINYAVDDNGIFTSTDVRQAAYWSVFSGACGFTYGAQPIWQFTDADRKKLSAKTFMNWKEGMELPGAVQVGYLRKLIESRPMDSFLPDQSLIASGQGDCANYCAAIRGKSFAYVYIPTGGKPAIQMGLISGEKTKASWFDPRTGETTPIGIYDNTGERSFDVPGMSKELAWLKSGRGCDWVLIIEDTFGPEN